MLTNEQREQLQSAFRRGKLRTRSVSPEGEVQWRPIIRTHRADIGPETVWRLTTAYGSSVVTGGHRVYVDPTEAVDAETLKAGDRVLCVLAEQAQLWTLQAVEQVESRQFMYDVCVEGNHNLVLHASFISCHNSPDRNYRFRPPEQEGVIGRYNRVFGFVWEDVELEHYLGFSLNWWNSQPPETEGIFSLDQLCQQKPAWKTFILWGAAVHALFALSINAIHDEFSLSEREEVRVKLPDGRLLDISLGELHKILNEGTSF